MKKLLFLFAAVGTTLFSSCQGPEGPAGYSAESAVYELTNVDFLPDSFAILFTFPHPENILPSDHVLVYRLSGVFQGQDVWQLTPQYYFYDDGTMNFGYNYDFTQVDVNIFIEGNDLATLNPEWTQNQVFRIVVVPGYMARSSALKTSDYKSVIKALHLEGKPVQKMQ